MSDDRLETTVAGLLAAERARSEATGDAAERILARLATSIAALPPGSDGSPPRSGGGPSGASSPSPGAGLRGAKLLSVVIGAFAAGAFAGALGHSQLTRGGAVVQRAAPIVVVNVAPHAASATSATSAARSAPTVAQDLPPSSGPPASSRVEPRAAAGSTASDKDVALSRERSWLEQARMAIARASWSDALAALDGHAREFPAGRMAEEREALAVHVLAEQGRIDEARARARSFRERHPSSVFLPVVARVLPAER
jgi:hypothetical protein